MIYIDCGDAESQLKLCRVGLKIAVLEKVLSTAEILLSQLNCALLMVLNYH